MKPEAKFLSYWSRILFLLFAVRGHQFCIMQDNIKKINYHLKVWPCTSAKLIGSQFRQMVSKIQECTICTKSSIFYQKWLWRPETCIKDGLEEILHEFLFETFCWEKQVWTTFSDVDPLFALMQHYPRSKFYLPTELFWKLFVNSEQPLTVLFKSCFYFNLLRNCNCQSKKWCSNRKSACKYLSWSRDLLAWVGTKARHFSIKDLQH